MGKSDEALKLHDAKGLEMWSMSAVSMTQEMELWILFYFIFYESNQQKCSKISTVLFSEKMVNADF